MAYGKGIGYIITCHFECIYDLTHVVVAALKDARKNGTSSYDGGGGSESSSDLDSYIGPIATDASSLYNPYEYHGYYVHEK